MWTVSRRSLLAGLTLSALPRAGHAATAGDDLAALNQKVNTYSREQKLLHSRIYFDHLARIDPAGQRVTDGRLHTSGHPLLVHLWSVDCHPCINEMPVLRQIMSHLQIETGIRVVFIAEDLPTALADFLRSQQVELPNVELWVSGPSSNVRIDLHDTSQPMTLLLDGSLVVRQAFIGQLSERRKELFAGVSRLLRGLSTNLRLSP